jgi:hypothetical protein
VLGSVGAMMIAGSVFAIDRWHDDDEDWTSDDFVILGVGLGGAGFALWGEDRVKHAMDAMNQAMWWYNGSLMPRSGP